MCRGGRTNDRRHARHTHADQCGPALAQSKPWSTLIRTENGTQVSCVVRVMHTAQSAPNTTAPGVMTPLKLSLCDAGSPPHEKRRTGSTLLSPSDGAKLKHDELYSHPCTCAALSTTLSVATPSRTLTLIPHRLEETHPTSIPTAVRPLGSRTPLTRPYARSFLSHTVTLRCTSSLLPSSLLKTSDLQTRHWARWCN